MQVVYLVPAVSQVDAEDAHAVEDKLHGGQEVIQHCRLQHKPHRSLNVCCRIFHEHVSLNKGMFQGEKEQNACTHNGT